MSSDSRCVKMKLTGPLGSEISDLGLEKKDESTATMLFHKNLLLIKLGLLKHHNGIYNMG